MRDLGHYKDTYYLSFTERVPEEIHDGDSYRDYNAALKSKSKTLLFSYILSDNKLASVLPFWNIDQSRHIMLSPYRIVHITLTT